MSFLEQMVITTEKKYEVSVELELFFSRHGL